MKLWWKSKTLWFNALAGVLMALEGVFHLLQPIIGTVFYPMALVSITLVNAFLRVITTQGLGRSDKSKP